MSAPLTCPASLRDAGCPLPQAGEVKRRRVSFFTSPIHGSRCERRRTGEGSVQGGIGNWRKSGGSVPVLALCLHAMLVFWGVWHEAILRNAAVLACTFRARHISRSGRTRTVASGPILGVNCGNPRSDRNIRGAEGRLPGMMAAWAITRRRCTWFWQ